MKRYVAEIEGAELDALVAKALNDPRITMWGNGPWIFDGSVPGHGSSGRGFNPSVDWRDGGPIIERARISLDGNPDSSGDGMWMANGWWGDTALQAAMRAYIAGVFGDEVEVP